MRINFWGHDLKETMHACFVVAVPSVALTNVAAR